MGERVAKAPTDHFRSERRFFRMWSGFASDGAPFVFFLVKCAFWLAIVFWLLPWGGADTSPDTRPHAGAAREKPIVAGAPRRERARAQRPPRNETPAAADDGAIAAMIRDGAAGLAASASERCLSRPADCVAAVEAVRRVAPDIAGSR